MFLLEIFGPILTALGSLLLAWRVKSLVDSLILAHQAAEVNFDSVANFLGNKTTDLIIVGGLDKHVRRSQRLGIRLLIGGFLLIAAGAAVSEVAIFMAG